MTCILEVQLLECEAWADRAGGCSGPSPLIGRPPTRQAQLPGAAQVLAGGGSRLPQATSIPRIPVVHGGRILDAVRQKLGDDPAEPFYLRTEAGVGYRLMYQEGPQQ